ncbi:LysE family translocator [Kiloniella laminariae]|uniref:LysE family translocator n=1 Tax=Kiloniella laminariae TaxID=454162 RepID=A0ABT4LF35_9PROT|nr:LysE family translocator [Kiloniella laminariae]MCZ4279716.1 LysE family translocator [Kiloniella laminariae]
MSQELWMTFVLAAAANTLTPGPAIVLAIKNGLFLGMRKALYSSLGNITAIGCVGLAVSLGLGALVTTRPEIISFLRLAGGTYLLWLGHQNWNRGMVSLDGLSPRDSTDAGINALPTPLVLFRQALVVGLTNPKMLTFLLALFPFFLDQSRPIAPQFLLMTGTFMTLSFVSLSSFALLAVHLSGLLRRPAVIRNMNRAITCIFVGFGLLLLWAGSTDFIG